MTADMHKGRLKPLVLIVALIDFTLFNSSDDFTRQWEPPPGLKDKLSNDKLAVQVNPIR